MIGTSASTNLNHKFYKSMEQAISRYVGECAANGGALCTHLFDMGYAMKTQVENVLNKLFNFQDKTSDVSDQAVFILKYLDIHFKEEKNQYRRPTNSNREAIR